jgi:spore germination protein KC
VKDFLIIDKISAPLVDAYNVITNKGGKFIVEVEMPDKKYVAVEKMRSKAKYRFSLSGKNVERIRLKVDINANINEVQSEADVFDENMYSFIEADAARQIKADIEACIRRSQEFSADYLGVSDSLSFKHPLVWRNVRDSFNELYPEMEIEVEVSVKIRRTYDIKDRGPAKENR